MSVIGRLDEQVDAVLITPFKKRGQHKEDDAAQGARSADRTDSSSETKRQAAGADKMSEHETPPLRDEVPVWLL